ncbi:transcription repressor OFP7-like [Phoenix dactylifera]|uniref:Transcription repressor n=1 Tax=Phoenix dactylifera TaxID=42345 RepID=A0A8B7CBK6_PHODC|nr:transcription repressor OFP7-like [Phoenix dactylifera]
MAKRFRLRLSRVITSFQSCRTKDDAGVTDTTTPSFRLSPVNHKALDIDFPPPPSPAAPAFLRRHPPVVSAACGCRPSRRGGHLSAAGDEADDLALARGTPAYLWRKDEKWHVVAYAAGGGNGDDFASSPRRKIDSDDGGDIFPPVAMARARRREVERRRLRRRAEARRSSRYRARVSTSSADSGWFSSDGDEENDEREGGDNFDKEDDDDDETETLVSSTDNSSDNVLRRRRMTRRRNGEVVKCLPSPEGAAAAVLRRLVPCGAAAMAEGKVRESFAVVKRSEDPRADFRRSMAEMVVEKEMYEAGDLEQLLHCFLSLNSRRHHGAIVAAFSDIWDALFPATATPAAAAPTFPKISYK